jgi:wobble nucleotide-excising tRNase
MIIKSVENLGCFSSNFKETNLTKNSFIYGLNGAGKTTIKNMIKGAFIEGLQLEPSFGLKTSDIKAELTVFNESIKFNKGKAIQAVSKKVNLHVFDTDYIENTVYINGDVSENHKHEYYRMFVGENINQKVENILDRQTIHIQNAKNLSSKIEKLDIEYSEMNNFNELAEETIVLLSTEYDQNILLNEVVKKRILSNIKDINEFSIDWFKKGIIVRKKEDICPFCGQKTTEDIEKNLIAMYTNINIELNSLNETIKENINFLHSKLSAIDLNKTSAFIESDMSLLRLELLEKLLRKRDDISKKYEIENSKLKTELKERLRYFGAYLIEFKNVHEDLIVEEVFSISDQSYDYNKVSNINSRTDNLIKIESLRDDLKERALELYKTQRNIQSKFTKIKQEQEQQLSNNLNKINKKIKEYNVKYEVKFEKYSQKTNTRQNHAQLDLVLIPIGIPSVQKKFNKDSLKKVLSEGEKSIIAWVFFVVNLESKLTKGKNIIVIDDPISSYDSYRRFNLVNDLKRIMSIQVDKELIVLSHEKSFTNTIALLQKMSHFNLIDGKLIEMNIRDAIESDLKFDIEFIKNNSENISDTNILEFVIRSRNFLEYIKMINTFANGKYFRLKEYNDMYTEASKLIHFKATSISDEYFKYIAKKYKQLTSQSISFNLSNIDITNISFNSVINAPIDNIYNARLKIDKYFFDTLSNNGINSFKGNETTLDLFKLAKTFLPENINDEFDLFIPIINTYNHPNQNYGLRRIDCSEISMNNMFKFVNQLTL